MPTDRRRTLGTHGERAAERHLASRGYRIVERNFRTRHGELDLVAADAGCLVFCEVKTRLAGSRAGPAGPLDAVGTRKRRRLRRLAGEWLRSRPPASRPRRDRLRFDAVGVTVAPDGRVLELEHVVDAF